METRKGTDKKVNKDDILCLIGDTDTSTKWLHSRITPIVLKLPFT